MDFDHANIALDSAIAEYVETIEELLYNNGSGVTDCFGDIVYKDYRQDTVAEFRKCITLLERAKVYANRIRELKTDSDEDEFHFLLQKDLNEFDKDSNIWE